MGRVNVRRLGLVLRVGWLGVALLGLPLMGWTGASSYRVQAGDTLSAIARRAGVSVRALQQANSLSSIHHLREGQRLTLPPVYRPATTYRVKGGDTLSGVAAHYGLGLRALLRANRGLQASRPLRPGQALYIPARRSQAPSLAQEAASAHRPARAAPSARGWLWPVHGWISSGYGERTVENKQAMHYGVDIVVPVGTAVRASRAGRVIESRADYARGWGWTIILDHGDGWHTRYAHLSANLARVGEQVVRGQTIARSGNTGHSTGPHLHFGTYLRGVPKDPLSVLP